MSEINIQNPNPNIQNINNNPDPGEIQDPEHEGEINRNSQLAGEVGHATTGVKAFIFHPAVVAVFSALSLGVYELVADLFTNVRAGGQQPPGNIPPVNQRRNEGEDEPIINNDQPHQDNNQPVNNNGQHNVVQNPHNDDDDVRQLNQELDNMINNIQNDNGDDDDDDNPLAIN